MAVVSSINSDKSSAGSASILCRPTAEQADRMIAETRANFRMHLASWASDCLALRRAGLLEFTWMDRDSALGIYGLAA